MPGDSVYDSRTIANYLIAKAGARGLTPLQLMKLVYIAHGFVLALLDRPLLEDDVEAWQYGPVVRRIYAHLPRGGAALTQPICDVQEQIDPEAARIVDGVFDLYGNLSGLRLSNLTHGTGSPWEKTWCTYGKNAVIPQDLIQHHYQGLVEKYRASDKDRPYSPSAL